MQCRSCGATLSTDDVLHCPHCQSDTPRNPEQGAVFAANTQDEDVEHNPYADPILTAPIVSSAPTLSAAKQSSQEAPSSGDDLLAYRSTPTPRSSPVPEKTLDEAISPPAASTTNRQAQREQPVYADPTFYGQPAHMPVPAPTSGYTPVQYATTPQVASVAVQPHIPFVSRKARMGLILLAVVMVVLVTTITLIPVLREIQPITGPSGLPLSRNASTVFTKVEIASTINPQTGEIIQSSSYKANTPFYVILHIDPAQFNFDRYVAYVMARFYLEGNPFEEIQPGRIDEPNRFAIFQYQYPRAGTGAVEIYFCLDQYCSDAHLATYTTFTVTS